MAANFMTFADVVEREDYDLWVGDEGWDLDYFLHENPELKRAPYVFLTDFIGVLPMRDDKSSVEFRRAWDKNAENIDHLRLHPDVRDLSIMVGDEDDVLDREFGPDLPNMRQWAREHFRFSGYTYHFDPAAYTDKAALRHELGYRPDERVILVSAGGTSVGRDLCARAPRHSPSWPIRSPMSACCSSPVPGEPAEPPAGPRIDVRPYVPICFAITPPPISPSCKVASPPRWSWRPSRHPSSTSRCATTSAKLPRGPPARPLGAGVRMDYDTISPEELGAAILDHLGKRAQGREVPTGGTERAAP